MYSRAGSVVMQRGARFWERVYGKVSERVMGQMDRCGTEDLGLLARLEYGFVLSPSGVLSARETSFGKFFSFILFFPFWEGDCGRENCEKE